MREMMKNGGEQANQANNIIRLSDLEFAAATGYIGTLISNPSELQHIVDKVHLIHLALGKETELEDETFDSQRLFIEDTQEILEYALDLARPERKAVIQRLISLCAQQRDQEIRQMPLPDLTPTTKVSWLEIVRYKIGKLSRLVLGYL